MFIIYGYSSDYVFDPLSYGEKTLVPGDGRMDKNRGKLVTLTRLPEEGLPQSLQK